LFALLVAHHTVLDPTLAVFDNTFTADPGELDPSLAPYENRLPGQIVRFARTGGLPAPRRPAPALPCVVRGIAAHGVKAAWDHGIPIVAGTDALPGLALSHELELYVRAGIPAVDVLALATLGAARVMGMKHAAGSIAIGKHADVVLIDGDPTRDITTLRNADLVVCRGVIYDPAALAEVVGMRRR
jgi:hypothetical protein